MLKKISGANLSLKQGYSYIPPCGLSTLKDTTIFITFPGCGQVCWGGRSCSAFLSYKASESCGPAVCHFFLPPGKKYCTYQFLINSHGMLSA